MSPEQARGDVADHRSDIWSFGVVLWEALTGERLFQGRTVSDVLAAVLREELDLSKLPSATPTSVRRLLRRCLVRDSRERIGDLSSVRIELREALSPGETDTSEGLDRASYSLLGWGRGKLLAAGIGAAFSGCRFHVGHLGSVQRA